MGHEKLYDHYPNLDRILCSSLGLCSYDAAGLEVERASEVYNSGRFQCSLVVINDMNVCLSVQVVCTGFVALQARDCDCFGRWHDERVRTCLLCLGVAWLLETSGSGRGKCIASM